MVVDQISLIEDAANRMRISSIEMTCQSKSGHPTSSSSAAEIVATLFFDEMHYEVRNPRNPSADRFVLSKGHACPILYAAWEEAGLLSHDDVLSLRKVDSDIEGHPTPRLSFIDVATGSLGQGLSCAAGMAYVGKYVDKSSYRVYCLMGDGEAAEGSVWEAASFASYYKLDNLVAIVDVNRLGQSQAAMLGHDVDTFARRFSAFGFHSIVVDGHSVKELLNAYDEARKTKNMPTAIIAKTFKGKGISDIENQGNWHGKPVPIDKANGIRTTLKSTQRHNWQIKAPPNDVEAVDFQIGNIHLASPPDYKIGDMVATRAAYGNALVKLGDTSKRIMGFDGDVKNSTFSEYLLKKHPDQFVECFIMEQNLVGVGIGVGTRGRAIPFCSTFAAFFTRAADQLRMGAISLANIKCAGSHAGVSIGEDGPSQMALEDLALFRALPGAVVFYPSDAVSTERAVELAANYQGIVFIRTGRPANAVLYPNNENFAIGKSKVVCESANDQILLIGAGVTLYECLNAQKELAKCGMNAAVVDLFSVKPLDTDLLLKHAQRVGGRVLTVEDHYHAGGIGEAVASTLGDAANIRVRSLAINEIPRSGPPDVLIDLFGISARHIVDAVKNFN